MYKKHCSLYSKKYIVFICFLLLKYANLLLQKPNK